MATNPHIGAATPPVEQELASVHRFYAALSPLIHPETGLGGKLLYAGELDQYGSRLVRAANIAGAATLAASANAAALRQAMRDGVIDFLVTSLDEALRILKNEIRKRQTVAVAVSLAPEVILEEMLDRGVLPDLLPITSLPTASEAVLCTFVDQGAQRIQAQPLLPGKQFLILPIPAQFAQSPAAFDALLRSHLPPDDHAAHRWLRLSPRYLGTQARRLRTLACSPQTASKLLEILGPSAQQ